MSQSKGLLGLEIVSAVSAATSSLNAQNSNADIHMKRFSRDRSGAAEYSVLQ
jgi:hypothetical protein